MDSNAHAHPFRPTNGRESKSTLPTGTEDDGWTRMAKIIRTIDEEKVKDCKEDIDTILVFAGLFSAVVTAFLVESYHDLLPDPTDTVISLLRQIATQSNSDGNLTETRLAKNSPAPTFQPPVNAQRVNILWFISLVLSLVSASFSIIVKQWLREYLAGEYTSPQARLRIRHFRNPGLYKWRVFDIAAILPLLLQASLAFFLTGLCFFTAHVHKTVEYATIPLVAGWAFFFAAFSFLPIFDPACPYKTPFLKTPIRLFRKWSLKSWPLRHRVFISRFTSLDFQPRLLTSEVNHIRGESHVVHDSTNDLRIILAVDAIQADDRLVKDMWRILQVTKSKPPVLCDFLLAVIGNRLQCDVSKAVPYSLLDLTPLPQETYDTLISMVTEVVESEVYRYTSGSLGNFNRENHSSFAWLERLVCVLLSTSRFPHSEATNSVLLSYFSKDRHTTLLSTVCSGLNLQSNKSGLRSLLMQLSGPLMLAQQDNPKLLITVLRQIFAPQPQRRHSNQPSFSISVEGSLVPFLDVPLPCHDLVLQLLRPLITTTGLDSNQIATLLALDAIRPENRVLTALPDAFEQRHINAQEYCDFVLAAVRHRLPRSAGVNTVRDLDKFMSSSDDVQSTVAHMVASLLVHAESLFTSPRHSTCPTPDTGSWLEKCILLLLTGSAHCTEQVSIALKPWFYYDQLFNVLLRIMRASADTRSHDFLSPFSRLQQALLLGWSTDIVLTRLEQIFQIRLDRPHEPTKLWQPLQTFYPGDDNTQPLSPPHRDFLHALYTKRLMLTAMNDLEIQYWTISDSFMLQEVLEHKGFRETADLVKTLLLSPSSCGSEGTAVFWQIAFGRDSLASMTVIRKTSHCAYEYVFKNLKSYERSQILHHLTQSLEASSSKSAAPTLFSDFKFTYDPVITCVAHLRILSNLCQTKQELGRDLRVSFFRVFKQLIPPLKEMTYDCQSNFEDYEDMADEALKLINTIVPLLQRPVPTALPRFVPLPVGLPHALHPLFRSRDPPAMRIHWEELDQQLDLVPVTNKNDVPSFSIVGVKNEGATLLLPDDQPLAQEESSAAVTLLDSRRPTVHRLRLVIPSTPDPTYDHPSRMYRRVSELGVDSSRQLEDGSPAHPSATTHRHCEGSESPNDIDNGDEHSDKASLAKDSDSNKPWSTGSHQPKGAAGDSAYSAVTSAHSVHDANSLGLSGLPHNPGHRLYVSEAYLDLHLDPETPVSVIVDSESDSIDSAPEGDKRLKPPTTITSRASIH